MNRPCRSLHRGLRIHLQELLPHGHLLCLHLHQHRHRRTRPRLNRRHCRYHSLRQHQRITQQTRRRRFRPSSPHLHPPTILQPQLLAHRCNLLLPLAMPPVHFLLQRQVHCPHQHLPMHLRSRRRQCLLYCLPHCRRCSPRLCLRRHRQIYPRPHPRMCLRKDQLSSHRRSRRHDLRTIQRRFLRHCLRCCQRLSPRHCPPLNRPSIQEGRVQNLPMCLHQHPLPTLLFHHHGCLCHNRQQSPPRILPLYLLHCRLAYLL